MQPVNATSFAMRYSNIDATCSTSALVPVTRSLTISSCSVPNQQHLEAILANTLIKELPQGFDEPFKRVPIGSPALLMRTHALSSNLTTLPSGLWYFLTVRTTTACLISPLRTLFAAEVDTLPPGPVSGPKFRCFWT